MSSGGASGRADTPAGPPRLLDRVRYAIRARHYSLRTEEAYVAWIKRFIFFHGKRHPAEMAEPEINQFVTSLAVDGQVSASTQTQALSALLFLYRHVLGKPLPDLHTVIRAKRPGRLPTVLTRAEVRSVIAKTHGAPRLVTTLLYGTGMRLLEALRLRVKDVEFGNNRIVVRDTKGGSDRVVPFPAVVRAALPNWLSRVRRIHARDLEQGCGSVFLPDSIARKYPGAERDWGWQYVFPGEHRSRDPRDATGQVERRHHLHETVIQRAVRQAVMDCRISRRVSCHNLPALLRNSPARRGVRYSDHPGAPGAPGREDDHDLYTRLEARRARSPQPCGPFVDSWRGCFSSRSYWAHCAA